MLLKGDWQFTQKDWEIPSAGPHEALMKIDVCGLCGRGVDVIDGVVPVVTKPIVDAVEVGRASTCIQSAIRYLSQL